MKLRSLSLYVFLFFMGGVVSACGGDSNILNEPTENSETEQVDESPIESEADSPTSENALPSATFTSPTANTSLQEGDSISVSVIAADTDGTVTNVTLYLNDVLVRQENISPYEWTPTQDAALADLPAGNHQLKAEARDNSGAITTTTLSISVMSNPEPSATGDCEITGDLQQFHRAALICTGDTLSEAQDSTFTDYRLTTTFTQGATQIQVPGHFAADGSAADTGAVEGRIWRTYFMPPSTGTWHYSVSFRQGSNIAVSDDATAGTAIPSIDNASGSFNVTSSSAGEDDMRSRGILLRKNDERYLRFSGDDSVFIQAGMDSPENIFGYSEFDNTTKFDNVSSCKGILHDFAPHLGDWNSGDPTWKNGQGKSLIGLLNYIASTGTNSVYIMAMTVNSDGCDAHPWVDYDGNRKAFDVSKLDQWERALSHMTAKGLMAHIMTQETENDQLLNNGDLGFERKLYYRELISRFSHHPALQWNLGEENTNSVEQQRDFANFIRDLDPYGHPIFMHTFPGDHDKYTDLLGLASFDGPTFQFGNIPNSATGGVYGKTTEWITRSAEAGQPWVVTMTEASGNNAPTPNTDVTSLQRIYWMWANVMAGGGGFEWYLKNNGSGHAYDLAVENLREFDQHWQQSGYLAHFFRKTLQGDLGINLSSLNPENSIANGEAWVLSDPGNSYILFLREGGNAQLSLPGDSTFDVLWFNPRSGQTTLGGTVQGSQDLGNPPSESTQDWAVVLTARQTDGLHPDIVRVADIPLSDITRTPQDNWKDSYSVGDQCYCDTTYDHNISDISVTTAAGTMTVRDACELVGPGPGASGRPKYNDVQCGNGPANDAGDEDYCPGRVDIGKTGCTHIGPMWKIEANTGHYQESDGLVVIEAENTASDLDLWVNKTTVSGYTGSGYFEFTGNSALNGPATSPLEYTFTVNQAGLYYLHLFVARETLVLNGETRTDVANDAFVRLDGDYGAGPNAGNNHQDDAPLSALQSDTKFFGGNDNQFVWATGARLDLGGDTNKRVAIYDLKAGETYTFTISGRSKFFKIDRFVFRHESVSASNAQNLDNDETR